jgi:ABC-type Fe3+ transport system permease subunit
MEEREGGIHSSLARRQERVHERTRARRRRALIWLVRALALIVVFFVGLVVGRALESAPRPGGAQTGIRKLNPSTLPPLTRTVTVTSSSP